MDDSKKPDPKSSASDNHVEIETGGEFEKLRADYDKLKNDFLYLGAEFENYKKHSIKERSELSRYGGERIVRDLLEVVDNFERALAAAQTSENKENLQDGLVLIYRGLQSLLNKHGVQEVDPMGQPFDPNSHDALTSEETDEYPPGTVIRVFKKAYRMHERLLRPAQVVVAKACAVETTPKSEE